LTLNAEGPNVSAPRKLAKMKNVITIMDKDRGTLTCFMQVPDGKWTQFMTMNVWRN
jgi:hypothetical protein